MKSSSASPPRRSRLATDPKPPCCGALRRGRSQLIGILLPDITNMVFAPILAGIAEVLSRDGHAPIVADAGNDASQQIAFCRSFP